MTMATLNVFEKSNQEVMFGDFGINGLLYQGIGSC